MLENYCEVSLPVKYIFTSEHYNRVGLAPHRANGLSRLAFSQPSPCGRVEIFDFGEGFYTDITSVILIPKFIMDSSAPCGGST